MTLGSAGLTAGATPLAETAGPPASQERRPAVAEVAALPPARHAADDTPVRMVQLATADPNVVIYWLFEEKGEER